MADDLWVAGLNRVVGTCGITHGQVFFTMMVGFWHSSGVGSEFRTRCNTSVSYSIFYCCSTAPVCTWLMVCGCMVLSWLLVLAVYVIRACVGAFFRGMEVVLLFFVVVAYSIRFIFFHYSGGFGILRECNDCSSPSSSRRILIKIQDLYLFL